MTDREKPSLAVALVAQEIDDGLAARLEAQLALWPTPMQVKEARGDDATAQRSGPGRPPGSRNKSTEEWRRWMLTRYRSPLDYLADVYARPVEVVAEELGCKLREAQAFQIDAAKALLPYLHQRQPLAVELSDDRRISLTIMTGTGEPGVGLGAAGVTIEGTILDADEADEALPGPENKSEE